jgi:hypothetical protein
LINKKNFFAALIKYPIQKSMDQYEIMFKNNPIDLENQTKDNQNEKYRAGTLK